MHAAVLCPDKHRCFVATHFMLKEASLKSQCVALHAISACDILHQASSRQEAWALLQCGSGHGC